MQCCFNCCAEQSHKNRTAERHTVNWPGCQYTDTRMKTRKSQRDTQLTWLPIHTHQNEEDQEDGDTTDLAVNTQTHQNEDQKNREIHNWPGCQYLDTPAWRPGRQRNTHNWPGCQYPDTPAWRRPGRHRDTQSTDLAVNTLTHQHEEDREDTKRHTVNWPGCQYPDTPAWRRPGRHRETHSQLTDLAVNTQTDQHKEDREDTERHTVNWPGCQYPGRPAWRRRGRRRAVTRAWWWRPRGRSQRPSRGLQAQEHTEDSHPSLPALALLL